MKTIVDYLIFMYASAFMELEVEFRKFKLCLKRGEFGPIRVWYVTHLSYRIPVKINFISVPAASFSSIDNNS